MSPTEPVDPAAARRHLTDVRRLVLAIIADEPSITADQIVTRWAERRPGLSARHTAALPRMTSQTLWRLENLGWVIRAHGRFSITEQGQVARYL
ncbi:hypothetical protein [Microbacterium sp. BR1]|uniref:hypothetical protein n=1 Tax=Microbacterium sp. BR1 TaxID=1070896 RepID=UPI0012FDED84|nr:hypothetical protein [Microbacterium sp. BR1]